MKKYNTNGRQALHQQFREFVQQELRMQVKRGIDLSPQEMETEQRRHDPSRLHRPAVALIDSIRRITT